MNQGIYYGNLAKYCYDHIVMYKEVDMKTWYYAWFYIGTNDLENNEVDIFKKYYDIQFNNPIKQPFNMEFMEGWDVGYSDSYDTTETTPHPIVLNRSEKYIEGYKAGFMYHSFMNYLYGS